MKRVSSTVGKISGFTLIEILVTIGILAVLFAIVLVALNVPGNFARALDTQRKSDVNQLRKALVQYFIDHKCYPTAAEYEAIECNSQTADMLKPYIAKLPCDPETGIRYYYQPLDSACQPCPAGSCGTCTGFRLMARLKNSKDADITRAGCDLIAGCGITDSGGNTFNWGTAERCPVPPPGYNPANTPTPNYTLPTTNPADSPTPTITFSGPTFTPTPTFIPPVCSQAPSVTPAVLGYDSYACSDLTDIQRFNDLLVLEDGIEWYNLVHGYYPDCGTENWISTQNCLLDKINLFIWRWPTDPGGTYPYIYKPYNKGTDNQYHSYCLGAHTDVCSPATSCSICPSSSEYTLHRAGRGDVVWRPNGNPLPLPERDTRDAKRVQDIQNIALALGNYKTAAGYYPQTSSDSSWTLSVLSSALIPTYLSEIPSDPGGEHPYMIVEWNRDGNGHYTDYCLMSYMDNSGHCSNNCGIPINNMYYCYGVKNP